MSVFFIALLRAWRLLLCLLLGTVFITSAAEAYVPDFRSTSWRKSLNCNHTLSRGKHALRSDSGVGGTWVQSTERSGQLGHMRAGDMINGEPPQSLLFSKQSFRELFAEFIGTFIIVALGTGSVMSDVFGGALNGLFQVAAVWVIAVTLAISTTGYISGAHLNPSISIAFAMFRPTSQFGWIKVLPYIIAQTAGATIASWINLIMYAPLIRVFEQSRGIVRGTPQSIASARAFGEYFSPPISTLGAFAAEAFGTALLAFVIFALTHPGNGDAQKNIYVPPLIGACVGGLIVLIAPLTQAGFNPARDFGPRIVAYLAGWGNIAFQGWWVYVAAPIVGAPIGAFVADKMLHA